MIQFVPIVFVFSLNVRVPKISELLIEFIFLLDRNKQIFGVTQDCVRSSRGSVG